MRISLLTAALLLPALAQAAGNLTVTLGGVTAEGALAAEHAYCLGMSDGTGRDGENISPSVRWQGAPEPATRSYALVMVDNDVPQDLSKAYTDTPIPADAPRRPFYHWVVANIPAGTTHIARGDAASLPATGLNDYAAVAGDKAKPHTGYDGPCPPWNDEKTHRYTVRVYALDTDTLTLPEPFTGRDLMKAIQPHVLASGEASATFSTRKAD